MKSTLSTFLRRAGGTGAASAMALWYGTSKERNRDGGSDMYTRTVKRPAVDRVNGRKRECEAGSSSAQLSPAQPRTREWRRSSVIEATQLLIPQTAGRSGAASYYKVGPAIRRRESGREPLTDGGMDRRRIRPLAASRCMRDSPRLAAVRSSAWPCFETPPGCADARSVQAHYLEVGGEVGVAEAQRPSLLATMECRRVVSSSEYVVRPPSSRAYARCPRRGIPTI
jgi:hypothetical protein